MNVFISLTVIDIWKFSEFKENGNYSIILFISRSVEDVNQEVSREFHLAFVQNVAYMEDSLNRFIQDLMKFCSGLQTNLGMYRTESKQKFLAECKWCFFFQYIILALQGSRSSVVVVYTHQRPLSHLVKLYTFIVKWIRLINIF